MASRRLVVGGVAVRPGPGPCPQACMMVMVVPTMTREGHVKKQTTPVPPAGPGA
jgi:hypothetical protein